LEQHWRQSGEHYQKTADAWLQNMDAHRDRIMALFCDTYGRDHAAVWYQRWRVFYMACAEMFGFARGQEWWVGHYRFVRPIDS
jgi:cyclopropane-fatty-acyl-phospholipid synthase